MKKIGKTLIFIILISASFVLIATLSDTMSTMRDRLFVGVFLGLAMGVQYFRNGWNFERVKMKTFKIKGFLITFSMVVILSFLADSLITHRERDWKRNLRSAIFVGTMMGIILPKTEFQFPLKFRRSDSGNDRKASGNPE